MQRRAILSLSAAAAVLTGSAVSAQLGQPRLQGMRTEDGITVQAVGRVRSVDRDSFTLVVRNTTYEVRATRREAIGNQQIRPGFRVRVFGELLDRDRIDAETVMIVSRDGADDRPGNRPGSRPRTLSGTIRDLDRDRNTFTLATAAGPVRVQWDRATNFVRNGSESVPREFKVGDNVRVVGSRSGLTEITARRVISGGQPGWSNGAVGEILSLDKRANELEVDFDGDVWVVRLANARITQGGRRVSIENLRLEQDVRVTGTARGSKSVDATEVSVFDRTPRSRDRDRD